MDGNIATTTVQQNGNKPLTNGTAKPIINEPNGKLVNGANKKPQTNNFNNAKSMNNRTITNGH